MALNNVNSFVKNNASKLHTSITSLRQLTGILVNEKGSLEETLAVAPVALANIVHAYSPTVGGIATRSNLSSLTNPVSFCELLNQSVLNKLLPIATITDTLQTTCKTVLGSAGGGVDLTKIISILGGTLNVPILGGVLGTPAASSSSGSSAGNGLNILTGGLTSGAGS